MYLKVTQCCSCNVSQLTLNECDMMYIRSLFFSQLESSKLKGREQSRTISDLEHQVKSQALTIKLLQAGKQQGVLMAQHTKEISNQIGPRQSGYLRPRSAESARKPNYRISDFKSRMKASTLQEGEFSIPLPVQNSTIGHRVDILNLEEQPEVGGSNMTFSLGPMVVTDDEYSSTLHEEKSGKPQRIQKLRTRGHRRTASTGSNVLPYVKEKEPPHHSTLPPSHPPSSKQKPVPKYPRRPGSAGSTRPDVDVNQVPEMKSPDQIAEKAQALTQAMTTLIDDHSKEPKSMQQQQQQPQASKESTEKSSKDQKSSSGMRSGRALSHGALQMTSNIAMRLKNKYSEMTRSKHANKSTAESSEMAASTSEGATSSTVKSDSGSDQHGSSTLKSSGAESANSNTSTGPAGVVSSNLDMSNLKQEKKVANDLNRTESMSSTCSTLSIFGPGSHLPSRNPSFSVYDGGESSPYSHESLEIGDSVENLQVGVNVYIYYVMAVYVNQTFGHSVQIIQ